MNYLHHFHHGSPSLLLAIALIVGCAFLADDPRRAAGGLILVFAIFALLSCGGCAELKPAALRVEAEHVSHVSQHEPFTDHPANAGFDVVSVGARWQPARNLSIVVMEGVCVDSELDSRREVFQARVAYEVPLS